MKPTGTLTLQDLGIGYGKQLLFPPFRLDIPTGTFNAVVGANGAGKSTLLQTMAGIRRPLCGRVLMDGRDVAAMSMAERARCISLTWGDRGVSGALTVAQLVAMGRNPYTGLLGRLNSRDKEIVRRAMVDAGIEHKAACPLADISDGERQRALVARALAQQTPVMLLDEPTNFLDAAARIDILELIARLVRRQGITAIVSGHDTAAMMERADNVITLLPDSQPPVSIDPSDSAEANRRLDHVFAHRGIAYDPASHRFTLRKKSK